MFEAIASLFGKKQPKSHMPTMCDFERRYGKELKRQIDDLGKHYLLDLNYEPTPAHRYKEGSYILEQRGKA